MFAQISTGAGLIDLVGTRDGRFLYVEVGTAGGVEGFRIKPDGTLIKIVTLTGLNRLEGITLTDQD